VRLSDHSIGTRLGAGFAIVLALAFAGNGYAFLRLDAAGEIQQTIEAIQNNVGGASAVLEGVRGRVAAGVTEIRGLSEPLASLQIARSTEKLASSSEQNAVSLAQNRETASRLRSFADDLAASVARFQLQ
jgi:methyl-accepting chemotaxis protein